MRISYWSSDVCSSDLRASQRLFDRQLQFLGLIGGRGFLPVDHAHDEIDRVVVGRKGQQYAAIHDLDAAIALILGLEADWGAVGDDLQIMVGQPRQLRTPGNLRAEEDTSALQ